jgi:hypothetical protein
LLAAQHPAFGSFLIRLPLLASDWNTIWEIFHSSETSSLLTRLADQFWVQDLRSERGLMPIHDVGERRKTCAARCPSAVSVLLTCFSVCDIWEHWVGWDFTEPWRFCFPELTKIGWHRRWSDDSQKAARDIRGKEVADQEEMGFSLNPRRPTTDKTQTRRFKPNHTSTSTKTTMDCVFSCSV